MLLLTVAIGFASANDVLRFVSKFGLGVRKFVVVVYIYIFTWWLFWMALVRERAGIMATRFLVFWPPPDTQVERKSQYKVEAVGLAGRQLMLGRTLAGSDGSGVSVCVFSNVGVIVIRFDSQLESRLSHPKTKLYRWSTNAHPFGVHSDGNFGDYVCLFACALFRYH